MPHVRAVGPMFRSRPPLARGLAAALAVVSPGCSIGIDPPPAPLRLMTTSVDERPDGVPPTAALILTFSAPLDAATVDERAVVLVRGAADDKLLAKLRAPPPLPVRLLERLAPVRL